MPNYCRTCGKVIYCTIAINLFEQRDKIMLHQIEAITGLCLLHSPDLPTNICAPCEWALREAIAFRERIIKTQQLLQSCSSAAESLKKYNEVPRVETDVDDADNDNEVIIIQQDVNIIQQEDDELFEVEALESDGNENDEEAVATDYDDGKLINNYSHSNLAQTTGKPHRVTEKQPSVYESVNFVDTSKKYTPRTDWSQLSEEEVIALKRERRKRNCICEKCGKHFSCASNFKVHLLRHTGVKSFSCSLCPQKFYTSHLLRRHEILHRCEKPYTCRYCTKSFSNDGGRAQHERNQHTNFKPYKCTECHKAFSASGKLKMHMLSHTGIREFHCKICAQSFLRKSHLYAHCRSKSHKQNEEKLQK